MIRNAIKSTANEYRRRCLGAKLSSDELMTQGLVVYYDRRPLIGGWVKRRRGVEYSVKSEGNRTSWLETDLPGPCVYPMLPLVLRVSGGQRELMVCRTLKNDVRRRNPTPMELGDEGKESEACVRHGASILTNSAELPFRLVYYVSRLQLFLHLSVTRTLNFRSYLFLVTLNWIGETKTTSVGMTPLTPVVPFIASEWVAQANGRRRRRVVRLRRS
eukprot:Plantae.Rhodophyta-Rhodochaete_pulchella.ctg4167.p1 GENE.Plantae.Rhodophyta-Rhodochaete_pulchella.ctg4167~~Plantae.Rhodophyta-Rhodochaete_pulchella.ctg4167.p1  ORF type:complete len:216 (+),score=10.34 Plantae.Rhodophyta-Rhodochaete_pulchella.ctg4167:591-1238(+)